MSLYNRAASVVCPSVRLSVNFCANRFFSQANGRIATKLARDGLQVSVHPGCAQGQGQRSGDTGTFVLARKSLLLAGKWPDRHQTCTRWTPGQRASRVLKVKVKVKGHVIRALLCWHENRFFLLSNCSIATKLAVDGLQESVAQILGSPISGERLFVGTRR